LGFFPSVVGERRQQRRRMGQVVDKQLLISELNTFYSNRT
jgi:hypothetical protein